MKKLVTLVMCILAAFVANAQTQIDSMYVYSFCSEEYYNFEGDYFDLSNWCVDSAIVIYDDDPNAGQYDIAWFSFQTDSWINGQHSITITKENEGMWRYKNYHTNDSFEFLITLATTPEETKVSFEREVPLEPCGTEIFAYDLIDGEENPRLSCLWDDGETSYSRIVYDDGTYTVTVSDSCGRQVSNVWLVGDYTNVNETVASSPSVYPNPSNGVFTIEGEGVYSIYNTVGQLVKTINVEGIQEIVLPSGLYFVRNDETTTKVVVR